MAGNITTLIDHKTLAEQAHEARLIRADMDLVQAADRRGSFQEDDPGD